jgi:hypothetical protein
MCEQNIVAFLGCSGRIFGGFSKWRAAGNIASLSPLFYHFILFYFDIIVPFPVQLSVF